MNSSKTLLLHQFVVGLSQRFGIRREILEFALKVFAPDDNTEDFYESSFDMGSGHYSNGSENFTKTHRLLTVDELGHILSNCPQVLLRMNVPQQLLGAMFPKTAAFDVAKLCLVKILTSPIVNLEKWQLFFFQKLFFNRAPSVNDLEKLFGLFQEQSKKSHLPTFHKGKKTELHTNSKQKPQMTTFQANAGQKPQMTTFQANAGQKPELPLFCERNGKMSVQCAGPLYSNEGIW